MLESFWSSIEIDETNIMQYISDEPYKSEEHKEEVVEKLDWVILKLYKIKDKKLYDYKIIEMMKNNIKINNCSLSLRGVDYLNSVVNELKSNIF
jgi:hypothetical protein